MLQRRGVKTAASRPGSGRPQGLLFPFGGPRGSGSGSAHRLVLLAPLRGPLGATPRPEGAQRAPSLARLPSSGPGVGGRGQRRASGLWVALGGVPRSSLASVLQLSGVGAAEAVGSGRTSSWAFPRQCGETRKPQGEQLGVTRAEHTAALPCPRQLASVGNEGPNGRTVRRVSSEPKFPRQGKTLFCFCSVATERN